MSFWTEPGLEDHRGSCPRSGTGRSAARFPARKDLGMVPNCIRPVSLFLVIAAATILFFHPARAQTIQDLVAGELRGRIEAEGRSPRIAIGAEIIYASRTLPLFYKQRSYRPAWSDESGPGQEAEVLMETIGRAWDAGLNPTFYHLLELEKLLWDLRQNQEPEGFFEPHDLAAFDLLCTDAFLIYGTHLFAGCLNPETIDPEWSALRGNTDLAGALQKALNTGTLQETLENLMPPQPGYIRLRQALSRYQDIAAQGGWPEVPEGPKIQLGDSDDRVRILRRRLRVTEDLPDTASERPGLFDEGLEQAVIGFQRRHGLDPDGVVGPATLGALNVTARERVGQLVVNMQRWCWLPHDLGRRHIIVNIANFELDVVEGGDPVLTMRAVVGKDYRQTPVFTDRMTYLVLNPYWNVPETIALEDKLPLIKEDPGYLTSENIRVLQGWKADAAEIDPADIAWDSLSEENFPYRLRQDPGPDNALGRIKFMFPNKYDVYLHDTPARALFARTERTFSSGCIRIEKPIELAEYLLREDPDWTREKILAAIEEGVQQNVNLPEKIPVHILYWTAWVTPDGTVHFRKDIYERDRPIQNALSLEPPRS
jgi:murein L,D-transpeptidase YcbB/YkuD